MANEMDEIRVEGAALLPRGESKTFEIAEERAFVVGVGAGSPPVAFLNRCPHVGVDLDMGTADFFSSKLDRLYCRMHGASFEVETGLCDRGPCVGQGLTQLRSRVEGEAVVISPEVATPNRP